MLKEKYLGVSLIVNHIGGTMEEVVKIKDPFEKLKGTLKSRVKHKELDTISEKFLLKEVEKDLKRRK